MTPKQIMNDGKLPANNFHYETFVQMKETNQTVIGWVVQNGSGWNHHKTADVLNDILASEPDTLPTVPPGYGVLVAPISDKPFGLRCALVKVLPRLTEDGLDDGPDGEPDGWAWNNFGMEVEKINSCKAEQQSDDDSAYFVRIMREQIAKL
jgi:hypothetical protein